MSLEVNMNTQTKRANPKYTLEFKQDAARLVNEKGSTYQQIVDHLGVSLSAIGRWSRAERRSAGVSSGKNTLSLSDQRELIRLRRKNEPKHEPERELLG